MAGHGAAPGPVLDALSSADPGIRRAALGAAWRLGLLEPARLTAFFADPDEAVARRAAELAGRLAADSPERIQVAHQLVPLLTGPLAEVAAFSLGELGVADDHVVAALGQPAEGAEDALVRESAVAALGALGAARGTVLAAMGDVATVRRRAVIALANFDGPDIDDALTAALDDRDWQVRQVAEDLLRPPTEVDGDYDDYETDDDSATNDP